MKFRDVKIKIRNSGDHDEASTPYEVTVASGVGVGLGVDCAGDAGPLSAGQTVTVAPACEITYTVDGPVELLLTVSHPDNPSLDEDPSNNTAMASVKVDP
jgi:hypothetical protein